MKNGVRLVKLDVLRPHERVKKSHLDVLGMQIYRDGFIDNPVIVDKNTKIILDGHHRFTIARNLGLRFLPVYFVDYRHDAIKVDSWRDHELITKDMVVNAGLSGKLLRPKTSRHHIPERPAGLRIPLEKLK